MTNSPHNSNLHIEGTPYFYPVDGSLRRMIRVTLPVQDTCQVWAKIVMDGETLEVNRDAAAGQFTFYGPPPGDQPVSIHVQVTSPAGTWSAGTLLPPARLWTIYVAQDKHLDYGWIHPVEQVVERINTLTDFYLDAGTRWNFDTSIWVEEYIRARPSARAEKLLAKLRSGEFEVSAFWLVPEPGIMGIEEMVHMLMAVRSLEKQGVPVRTAMLQEAPSLSWGMTTVLAGAGLPYAIKGAYDLRNPHLKERDPYPLAFWEGPDGSRVLLRWDCYADTGKWGGYGEGYVFWRKTSDTERAAYVDQTIARYEAYEHYPLNAILLAGTGFDEFPQTTAVSDFIYRFNNQGWAYPRLVDATWNDFWRDVEGQVDPAKVPVVRGDWGTAWEEWAAQQARITALYRRAREKVLSAQTLAALVYPLDPATHPSRLEALTSAWRGLMQFDEHDFGGISPQMAEDTYETKATYAHNAMREGSRALESAVSTLASLIPAHLGVEEDTGRRLVVANPNNWQRGGVVEVVVQDAVPYEVTDLVTGQPIPCQLETRGPGWLQHYLSFAADDVPSFGYRSYRVRQGGNPASLLSLATTAPPAYENDYYRLVINPSTGGLDSLIDKTSARNWVGSADGYALNEYLHISEGVLQRAKQVSITLREGPFSSDLVTEVTSLRAKLRTTYRLYRHIPRLDITNELHKESSAELQASWFAFPFAVQQHQFYYDGAAVILRPGLASMGGDLLPGSGLSSTALQSFLAVTDPAGTLLLASPDAYLFQFGAHILNRPLDDSDPKKPLALSLALHNFTRNDFVFNQGGQEYFTFRYSLHTSPEPFKPSVAVHFAREMCQDLPRAWITGDPGAPLQPSGSFAAVTPGNVIVTGFKVAEDSNGWILRLWECEGRDTLARVDVQGMEAARAWVCDLLERDKESLPLQNGVASVMIPARGLSAIRFID